MKLYNTLTRNTEPFAPSDGNTVGMYVCGPTVYDHVHIGNLRPILVFDTLRRYLEQFKGWTVIHVQNVTDVDDKLIARSIETGESVESIADTYTKAYFDLLDGLGVLKPTHSPLATEHIDGMIALVADLVEGGFAYERDGDVYFRVASLASYGRLSGRRLEEQEAGARIEASDRKENPLDFTLWKAAKPGEPRWPSPWGDGRPGWHTECVVLSRQYLGERLDIHAGGNDLIFPHHENEMAQAEALSGQPFFRFWLHNGMLSLGGEKMSKSLGNFDYAKDVLAAHDAATVRYFYLSRHYRKPLEYTEEGFKAARAAIDRVESLLADIDAEARSERPEGSPSGGAERFVESLEAYRRRYVDAMDDDLNTVGAIGVIQEIVAETNRFRADAAGPDRLVLDDASALIREFGRPLGLFQATDDALRDIEADLVALLLELRQELRAKKDFEMADRIRDRLVNLGLTLKDTAQGTLWTKG